MQHLFFPSQRMSQLAPDHRAPKQMPVRGLLSPAELTHLDEAPTYLPLLVLSNQISMSLIQWARVTARSVSRWLGPLSYITTEDKRVNTAVPPAGMQTVSGGGVGKGICQTDNCVSCAGGTHSSARQRQRI